MVHRNNTRVYYQVTITVITVLISVRLDFISFVTGMHFAVPLTSALCFSCINFVTALVFSSHNAGFPATIPENQKISHKS